MKTVLLLAILLIEILVGLWNIIRYLRFKKKCPLKQQINHHIKEKPTILIAIPCLREQDIIQQTLDHFLDILPEGQNISIIIVTTQKEVYEKNNKMNLIHIFAKDILNNVELKTLINNYNELLPTSVIKQLISISKQHTIESFVPIIKETIMSTPTTYELLYNLKQSNSKYKNLHIINYPFTEGMMAHQLNYVLKNLNTLDIDTTHPDKNYFLVYNADSMPDKKTMLAILDTIYSNNYPKVIQQCSCCMSNWHKLSNIMKGFALYQSNFELKSYLVNTSLPSDFLFSSVVGHGMCIRLDKLIEIDGFETSFWCEDIYMGCYLRNENTLIYPIYALENMEAPEYLPILIKQHAVWFNTAFECIKIYAHVVKRQKKITLSGLGWLFQRLRMNIAWLISPFFIFYTFLYPLITSNLPLLILSIFSYLFMISSNYFTAILIIEYLSEIKIASKFKALIYTSISVLISNFGPIYSLIKGKKKKYKTAR